MKKLIYLFFLILFAPNLSAQDALAIDTAQYIATYDYFFQEDSTSKQSIKHQEMELLVGNHFSLYSALSSNRRSQQLYLYQLDVLAGALERKIGPELSKFGSRHRFSAIEIYKNRPSPGLVLQIDWLNHKFLSAQENVSSNWKLEAGSDSLIAGYHCQQASIGFGGRVFKAWYTTEIPISEGPYKFAGLPGLIVRIADSKHEHTIELTSFSKASEFRPILTTRKPMKVSTDQFWMAYKQHLKEMEAMSQNLQQIQTSDENRAQMLHKLRRRNNYIEKI